MGLFLRQEDSRSELQSKIAADLQERLKDRAQVDQEKPDPAILDDQHQTRSAGMVLIILGAVMVVVLVILALRAGGIL